MTGALATSITRSRAVHAWPARIAPVPRWRHLVLEMLAVLTLATAGCGGRGEISDEAYREAVVSFYTGLAALQTSQEVLARDHLERVTKVAPDEPAAWANIGLLLLRQQELDAAFERLAKAAELAPDNADIQRLLGLTESRRGNLAEAVRYWQRALALRPGDPKAAYALALDLERQGTAESLREAQRVLDELAQRTGNTVALVEFVRVAAKRADADALGRGVSALSTAAARWPPDIQERFRIVQQTGASDPGATGQAVAFLKNVLMRLPDYRRWLAALSTPREEVGEPLERLVILPNPPSQPAPADESLTFTLDAETSTPAPVRWAGAVTLDDKARPVLAAWDGASVRFGSGQTWKAASAAARATTASGPADAVLAADLNYDFRTDLVVSTAAGLTFVRQRPDGTFADVTAAAKLPATVRSAAVSGLWAADVDTDGDLDVVAAVTEGPLVVLRNNGDDTFTLSEPFAGAARVRAFAWADVDGEGVPDAAVIDASGRTRLFLNRRGGVFQEVSLPKELPKALALAAAEVTGDAVMDVLVLTAAGDVVMLSHVFDTGTWTSAPLARTPSFPGEMAPGTASLIAADLDNNAATDIVVSTPSASHVLLRGPSGARALPKPVPFHARAAADFDGDGRLELAGTQGDGRPAIARGTGQKRYGWHAMRPHAATSTGDQRINSFAIGGEVEVRTGLHAQRVPITSPIVHVGLGEARSSEVVRITWPNGTLQSEFSIQAGAPIPASQRLKGSCPWLFAWNGREMAFVTDVLWRSPLGLRINAQDTADVLMTEDWVRLGGDQLAARDGWYDVRITAELWETHFFDFASLLVVDHPAGTEVFVDERFAVPPPRLGVIVTGPVQPARVRDDRGQDVTDIVRTRDDRHLDFAGRGMYQGITRDHFVEIELPESAPRTGPLWLVAQGWIHPTDSSINVALGQGSHPRPRGLKLEVADRAGRFRVVRDDLGFPAGKDKTILVDLSGLFPPGGARRLRLSTNLEIYWDRLGWAIGRPDVRVVPRRAALGQADLRYRGYSRTDQHAPSSPERPRYALEGTTPRWRDLEGYHTRFGDVRELLTAVDDRYVIMNAGDELQLLFREGQRPAAGMQRDFVMVTDGWEKDGDFNTRFSRTVLPLPTHASGRYDRPPGRLEDDPVYRMHPRDFAEYHTRYVTSEPVRDALRGRRDPAR